MNQSDNSKGEDIDSQLNMYDDRIQKAKKRYEEICRQKQRPSSIYYFDENNNLVNKIDETVKNQKVRNEETKEMVLMRNVNKAINIEKLRLRRENKIKRAVEKHKTQREEKFMSVKNNSVKINQEFDQHMRNKLKKYREKQKSIEERNLSKLQEQDKRKNMNLFRYLDQKENFKREKMFYKKFTDKILSKHQMISQIAQKEKERENVIQELRRKNEQVIKNDGSLLVTNYFDSYLELQTQNPKTKRSKSRLKPMIGTGEFDLLKVLPKIKDEKKEEL